MSIQAVLVYFKTEEGEEPHVTSGILFSTNTALISGTCLIPLVQKKKKWVSEFVNSSSPKLAQNEYARRILYYVVVECRKKNEKGKVNEKFESAAIGVWKCPLVCESLLKLFRDWTFGQKNLDGDSELLSLDDINLSKELMSIFIVLKCRGGGGVCLEQSKKKNELNDGTHALLNLMLILQKPIRGQEVEVVSTPFGSEIFMNSLSRGIISNVVGWKNCIILCDARTVSGCEGGAIFVSQRSRKEEDQSRNLSGIVTCPLTSWRGEWVGLTIGVSLLPVLEQLLTTNFDGGDCVELVERAHSFNPDLSLVNFVDEIVVVVRRKSSWGSGVILNAASGIIITCSHVVEDEKRVCVFHKGNDYIADVVFKSTKGTAYDLAIIKVRCKSVFKEAAVISKHLAKIGDAVAAAGFPFFSEKDENCIRPTIVSGCISRVNPYIIQTTCCIQSGFSGGALFSNKELLGIIVSNARSSTTGALFPHINFIVPSSVFREPVLKYIENNDLTSLGDLECSDFKIQALWKLQSSKL